MSDQPGDSPDQPQPTLPDLASIGEMRNFLTQHNIPCNERPWRIFDYHLDEAGNPQLDTGKDARYIVGDKLGKGGSAEVYQAYDRKTGRQVAVKVLHNNDREFLERFHKEAELMAAGSHRDAVAVYDFYAHEIPKNGTTEPGAVLIMELMNPDNSLRRQLRRDIEKQRLERQREVPLSSLPGIVTEIATQLDYASDKGIIHRDIKPDNIFMRSNHHPALSDFGISQWIHEPEPWAGRVVGSPKYMSPEGFEGDVVDRRHDIRALGILLYEILTQGEHPFGEVEKDDWGRENPVARMIANRDREYVDIDPESLNGRELTSLGYSVPEVNRILKKATAKDRNDRHHTATELAHNFAATFDPTRSGMFN